MLRGRDLVGRIGGDQFVSLLPETSMPDAMHVAERMARHIADKQDSGNRRPVQLSFGLILVQGDETLEHAIHRASEALAEAKRQGRNCVVSASTQDDGSFRLVAVRALGPMA
jgi:diguanylate cyclase (GGDEF)-like protein